MKLLTTRKERSIVMEQLRPVSKTERIVFPIVVTIAVALLVPSAASLVGMLMLGNLLRECGVTERLSKTAQNELCNIVTIFLGTNGTTSNSGIFTVSNTTILRFMFLRHGYLPSKVVTRSYIKKDKDYYMPIISVTTAEENLYDDSIGVYVDGVNGVEGRNHAKSNRNMDWERPVNVEILNANGDMIINQEAEFKVSGGWSRHFMPASFKIKASKNLMSSTTPMTRASDVSMTSVIISLDIGGIMRFTTCGRVT